MAPKEPYKVHSLNKQIQDAKKGVFAESQLNRRTASRAPIVKRDPDSFDPNQLFTNNGNDDDDDAEDTSDSNSDDDEPGAFLAKLATGGVKAPSTPARRRNKDVEIADSDDERNVNTKAAPATKSVTSAQPKQESSGESSEESESEDDSKGETNGVALDKVSESSSSDSSDSESESESDDEPETAKKTKLAESGAASSDESSSEESDSESEAEPAPKAKPQVNGNTAAKTTTSSESSDEDESESDSDSDSDSEDRPTKSTPKPATKPAEPESESSSSEEEDSDDEMVDESMHIEHRQDKRKVAVPNFIAPDFVLRKGDDGANGKDVAQICNQANLEGKQFWYFTVPSNVPISVVQNLEIPMDNSQSSDAIFSHDGEDYGVSFESIAPKSNIQILIPSSDGSQYQSSPRQISQVMQVKKITQLASFPSAEIGPAGKRPPRPQPENLNGRYQPIGVGENNADEDTEMTEAPAVFKTPGKKEKKRKDKETAVATPATEKAKKQKKSRGGIMEPPSSTTAGVSTPDVSRKGKRKHAPSEEDAAAASEQLIEESKSAATSKKQKTNRSGSPDLGSEAPSTSSKQTPVPAPSFLKTASTPASKKSKKSKVELPPPSAQKQTPIPIPNIPHSSQSRGDSAHAASPSAAKEEKRSKKRKESKNAKESAETPSRRVTPVLPPVVGSSN